MLTMMRRLYGCASSAKCLLALAIAAFCSMAASTGAMANANWGQPIRMDSRMSGMGYLDLTPQYKSIGSKYLYTYTLTSHTNGWNVDQFQLSFSAQLAGLVQNAAGFVPDGWSAEPMLYVSGEKSWKLRWNTVGDTTLRSGKAVSFTFECSNNPDDGVPTAVGTAESWSTLPNVSAPAPVPEPSSLFAAISILAPVGVLGRRVFCK